MAIEFPTSANILLKETSSLISMPEICLKLRKILVDPNYKQEEISNLIINDPALTTRILKIVNSAYYGLQSRVKTISHALNVLGKEEINNLVIVTAIINNTNNHNTSFDLQSFWKNSIYSAVIAKNLSAKIFKTDTESEESFITGLLLNVGKLLLYCREPELLIFVEKEMHDRNVPDYIIEKEQLGFDHAEIGALITETWNFPNNIVQDISKHHLYSHKFKPRESILFTASLFSDAMVYKNHPHLNINELNFKKHHLPEQLGLSKKDFCYVHNKSYENYLHVYEACCGR